MRAKFKLVTHAGYIGDLHTFWNSKPIPKKGEQIVLNTVFSEGIFLPNEESTDVMFDNLKKDAKKLKQLLRELQWTVCEVIKNSKDGEVQLLVITVNELSK